MPFITISSSDPKFAAALILLAANKAAVYTNLPQAQALTDSCDE
jgi:hypothetical protein